MYFVQSPSTTVVKKVGGEDDDNDNPLVAPKPIDSDASSDDDAPANASSLSKNTSAFDGSPAKAAPLFFARDESPPKVLYLIAVLSF